MAVGSSSTDRPLMVEIRHHQVTCLQQWFRTADRIRQAGLAKVVEVLIADANLVSSLQPSATPCAVVDGQTSCCVVEQEAVIADLREVQQMAAHVG